MQVVFFGQRDALLQYRDMFFLVGNFLGDPLGDVLRDNLREDVVPDDSLCERRVGVEGTRAAP